MPNWSGMILTKKGLNLQAKVEAGVTLNFTKMKVGDGILGSSQTLENLNDLIGPKQTLGITSVTPQNGGLCKISSLVTNIGLENGYYVREVGLFATDPDLGEILYAVSTDSSPDYLPPEGGSVVVNEQLDIYVGIGNAANITANINPSGLVTVADLEEHNSSEHSHPNYKRGWAIGRNYVLQGVPNGSGVQEAIRKLNDNTLEMPAGVLLNFAAGMNDYGPVDVVEKLETAKTITPTPANAFTIPLAYTEDLCVDGTPISSGDYTGYPKTNLFDNNPTTDWRSSIANNHANTAYVGYIFTTEKLIRLIKITSKLAVNIVAKVEVQKSNNNGGNWDTVTTADLNTTANSTTVTTLPATQPSTYWRILAKSNLSNADWTIAEIEMMEALETHYVAVDRDPVTKEKSLVTTKSKPRVAEDNNVTIIPGYYTADLCEGGTPISGGDWAGFPANNAFDNNPATNWGSSQVSPSIGVAYIGYDFGEGKQKNIRKVTINPYVGACFTGVKIQKSNDKEIWDDIGLPYSIISDKVNELILPQSLKARYWRLLANGGRYDGLAGGTNNYGVIEIEMMEYVEPQTIISDDTKYTDNVCVGGVAISSGDWDTNNKKENVFNGLNTDYWSSNLLAGANLNTAYIGYDFGVGRQIRKIILLPRVGAGATPAKVAIQATNNSSGTWTDIRTNVALIDALNIIDLPASNNYRYWRIFVTDATGIASGQNFSVCEITMHELATDLDYYDPINGLTKHFDGTTWTDKQRIYVGEAQVDSAGKIVKVTNYPIGLGNLRVKDAERKDEPVALGQFEFWGDALSGGRRNPDGSIEQWGVTSSIAHNTTKIIMFPKVFPNACTAFSGVILGDIGATATSLQLINKTPISANVKHVADSNATAVYLWTAIGY